MEVKWNSEWRFFFGGGGETYSHDCKTVLIIALFSFVRSSNGIMADILSLKMGTKNPGTSWLRKIALQRVVLCKMQIARIQNKLWQYKLYFCFKTNLQKKILKNVVEET